MTVSGRLFAICCVALVLAIGTASTIPPQVVTTQHQSYELNVTSDTPVSVNDNATVAETEASVTTDAITTTATTTINTTTETLKHMPVSVNDNTTVAETEASVTTDAITTTATTTINTTTETLKPPYKCYDCNSGSPLPGYWRNTNCDESGYVADWYMPKPCDTFCFSSVGRYPAGAVFRGCAKALYLPGRVLQDGCFEDKDNNRYVCLCSGDQCNTHNLTAWSQDYVEQSMNSNTK